MTNEKITSQVGAEIAIKTTKFIVGSVDSYGTVSFSQNPTTHFSVSQARQECKRLAAKSPGKTFFFAQLRGAERTVAQPSVISI